MKQRAFRFFAAALAAAFAVSAEAADTRHIRGIVVDIADGKVSVKTATGKNETFAVTEQTRQFLVIAADLSAVTKDKFVGVTSFDRDGKRVAREVHVFPESLRGSGEGDRPWDLQDEGNHMTNANIGVVESVGEDRVLKLDYKDGSQTISIPASAKIVLFDKAPKDALQKDAKVFVRVKNGEGGALEAVLMAVGANGIAPPM